MTPYFKHDCECCTFLGTVDVPATMNQEDKNLDLYFCGQGGFGSTVIARFGSEDPDYMSGLSFPQVFARQVIESGVSSNAQDALEYLVKNTKRLTEFGLSMAALKAIEMGCLDSNLNPIEKESKRLKM